MDSITVFRKQQQQRAGRFHEVLYNEVLPRAAAESLSSRGAGSLTPGPGAHARRPGAVERGAVPLRAAARSSFATSTCDAAASAGNTRLHYAESVLGSYGLPREKAPLHLAAADLLGQVALPQPAVASAESRAAAAEKRARQIRQAVGSIQDSSMAGRHPPTKAAWSLSVCTPVTSLGKSFGAGSMVDYHAEGGLERQAAAPLSRVFSELPPQVLCRLAFWLTVPELARLLLCASPLWSQSWELAAWVAREQLVLSRDELSWLCSRLRLPCLRAMNFALRRLDEAANHAGRHIAVGLQHFIAVRNGAAFSWGAATSGALGHGSSAEGFQQIPQPVPLPLAVKLAACGGDHTLLLTTDGRVWAFGRNSDGQLGTGCQRAQTKPVHMTLPTLARSVACGADHSVVLAADASVWSCGRGGEGQLGLALRDEEGLCVLPTQVELSALLEQPQAASGRDSLVDVFAPAICQVSCGADHTMLLDTLGRVFSCGENCKGQLGLGHRDRQELPALVSLPAGVLIVSAACGGTHSALLADDGYVWGCGGGEHGQLGCGFSGDRLAPSLVMVRPLQHAVRARALRVSCGFNHTVLLSPTGKVWALGGRRTESPDSSCTWRVRGYLERLQVSDVACAGSRAICSAGGHIFTFDANSGLTDLASEGSSRKPSLVVQKVPV
eukprot:TRINITY_DN41631_c0_g1_i1.p1 TRINITY_DN41631_c0_g1~~TRINITY_DN41631_c0_g1_i1.p1  ORF type:complete len:668 (-),score=102.82 TRINITY_DN41631_c0_g1_i1:199-2202(-)